MMQYWVALFRKNRKGDWMLEDEQYRGPFTDPADAYRSAGLLDSFNNPNEDHRVLGTSW